MTHSINFKDPQLTPPIKSIKQKLAYYTSIEVLSHRFWSAVLGCFGKLCLYKQITYNLDRVAKANFLNGTSLLI
jgi:hypothetical protein